MNKSAAFASNLIVKHLFKIAVEAAKQQNSDEP